MIQLHTPMRRLLVLLIAALFLQPQSAHAEAAFTRVYMLKYQDSALAIQAIKYATIDTSKKRIISGVGKKLVITDIEEKQDEIARLLPIIDQPSSETDPRKLQMEVAVRVTNYLNTKAKESTSPGSAASPAVTSASRGSSGPAVTYDTRKSTQIYKSVYSDEDAQLSKGPRIFKEDPPFPAISNLQLKGIFLIHSNSPMALLRYENVSFTAREGRLFYNNRTPLKGYTTRVLKDHVIVTGPDRIPHAIKFRSSL